MKLKQKREALVGVNQTRAMQVSVSRTDETPNNTLTFVFVSAANAGTRYSWSSGEYYTEQLDIKGATVERLNTFFKDHYASVDSAVGKITNVRIEGEELVGDVTFGSDDVSQRVYSKYLEGILTDVSIAYEIRDYKVEQGADNVRDKVTVTDFDIFEVSAVGIGFDSGAKKRKVDNFDKGDGMTKEQLERLAILEAMLKRNADENAELVKLQADKLTNDVEVRNKALEAENVELKRQATVAVICDTHNVSKEQRALYMADKNITADAVRSDILDAMVNKTPGQSFKADDENSRSKMIDAMVDGLALRVGAKIKEPAEGADQYRYASLVSIGNALLSEENRSFNPNETAERALLTGDFPMLLQSVGARVLTAEFEAQTGTYKAWMKEVDVPDFRVMTDLTASIGGGRLDETLENGDLRELSATEGGETWKLRTFGNKFVITRQMIINDDLGHFTDLIATFGRMAMTTANGEAYDLLRNKGKYANYKMADGKSIYDNSRNNSSAVALSSEALSAGRLAMSKHKSMDKKTPLHIVPKYLIVSPALEVTAKEILGATSKQGSGNQNVPNVNQNSYELIVDPELSSDTEWYLLADFRTLKMGYLAGTNRSPVTKIYDATIARTTYEGVFDIGVTVEDYRGIFRGNV